MKTFKVEVTEFVLAMTQEDAVEQARSRNPAAAIISCEHVLNIEHEMTITNETQQIIHELRTHNDRARMLALGRLMARKVQK